MALLLALLVANIICSVIDTLSVYITALAYRAPVIGVELFRIPFLKFQLGSVLISIGCIPIGGCVRFNSFKSEAGEQPAGDTDLGYFEDLGALEKLSISLSGPVVIFTVCAVLLSPGRAFGETLEGFMLFFRGAFDPGYRERAIGYSYQIVANSNYSVSIALLLTKFLAMNLLPLLPFRGFALVRYAAAWIAGRDLEVPQAIASFSVVASLGIIAPWLVHLILFVLRSAS